MLRNLKVGQKLAVLLVVISVAPLLAMSYYSYHVAKSELEKKTIAALQAVADSRAAHINHAIQLRQEQAKEFAGAFLPRKLSESGVNDPQIVQGIQNDIDATFLDLNLTPSSTYQNIDKTTDIEIIGVWDVHGKIIANTNPDLIGLKMPPEYLQQVYEKGTYFRGFEKDPLTGKNFLIHLEEIRSWQNNRIVGALSLKIRAKILDEITTARAGLGVSGETYIVDKKLRLITRSRFLKDAILKVTADTPGVRACFGQATAPPIYKNYRGVDVLGVQKYLPDQQWCLVAEIDAQEALSSVQALKERSFFIVGLLFVAILLFAYFASKSFTRPILSLSTAAQEVAKGNYVIHVDAQSGDEIGVLTRAFNEMTASLSQATQELQEKSQVLFQHLALTTKQKKELKDVNQELDSFVYTASHDLRAPLRGIASFASFLEEDYKNKLDEQGKDYINEIRKGANKMNDLIEDLLQLSRISRIKNPYEPVKINELIGAVVERITFDIQENNVALTVQENMPAVMCDRIKISEVFLNLINNAIKFSSKNNPDRPRVQVGYLEEERGHKFFVKDNGIGIDPKYHDQIFGIFKRLHTDKEYEGTGAGLSIIKRVIEDHQGRIWLESQLGQGTTFFFTIPKDLKNEEDPDIPGPADQGRDSGQRQGA